MINRRALLILLSAATLHAQSLEAQLKAEHDPVRRSDKALALADEAFDNAKDCYGKGLVHKGDEQLDNMTAALNQCVQSLEEAHKARFFKKAELHVAALQRRMRGLLDELSIEENGWAEYTDRKLEEVHEKLLEGVMRK